MTFDPTKPIRLVHLLDLLGYTEGERYQLAMKPAGGQFSATVHGLASAQTADLVLQDRTDYWFGVNPVASEIAGGRPNAGDVTRLAGLWADLDVKPGGCPTMQIARRIADELGAALGVAPVALTQSGHGLQPIWAIEDAYIAGEDAPATCEGHWNIDRSDARALLRRWGRLVATVAERFGAGVDTVFDLPRILRMPNSVNWKGQPVHVVTHATGGAPVSVQRALEVLDEYGIADLPEDHDDPGAVVSAPAEWSWGRTTCGYAELTIRGWAKDDPADRHPWLVAQATRVAAMHRYGCLTEPDHRRAVDALIYRFRSLLARSDGAREPGRGEISDAFGWGQQRAAAMLPARLAEELGGHAHKPLLAAPTSERMTSHAPPAQSLPSNSPDMGYQGIRVSNRPEQGREIDRAHNGPDRSVDVGIRPDRGEQSRPALRQRMEGRPTLRELIAQAEASDAHRPGAESIPRPGDTAATVAPTANPETPEQAQYRIDLQQAALRERIRTEARAIERQRQAGDVQVPKPVPLADFLARDVPDAQYRIAGLLPIGGRVVVSAQFKSGKSVMMGNLVRALADGDQFLGAFDTDRPAGRIVLLDDELDERTLHRWLAAQGIVNVHNVEVISLRGRVATFDLTNDVLRAEWAQNLREVNCGFLIFDCLRPVLDAIGLSEDKESGAFLVALDALALDAGVSEMAVVHHMGHTSERARGDSRLRDWPDAEWKIVRESGSEDDPAAPRYFSAFGRDVDVKEGRLVLDGKRLTYKPGEARQKTKSGKPEMPPPAQAIEEILGTVGDDPISKRGLRRMMMTAGYPDALTREAIDNLIAAGLISVREGARRAQMLRWVG